MLDASPGTNRYPCCCDLVSCLPPSCWLCHIYSLLNQMPASGSYSSCYINNTYYPAHLDSFTPFVQNVRVLHHYAPTSVAMRQVCRLTLHLPPHAATDAGPLSQLPLQHNNTPLHLAPCTLHLVCRQHTSLHPAQLQPLSLSLVVLTNHHAGGCCRLQTDLQTHLNAASWWTHRHHQQQLSYQQRHCGASPGASTHLP